MKLYRVLIGGIEHTMLLDAEDAAIRGLSEADRIDEAPAVKTAIPANKSRATDTKTKG